MSNKRDRRTLKAVAPTNMSAEGQLARWGGAGFHKNIKPFIKVDTRLTELDRLRHLDEQRQHPKTPPALIIMVCQVCEDVPTSKAARTRWTRNEQHDEHGWYCGKCWKERHGQEDTKG